MKGVHPAACKARKHFALHCRRFIEKLPRVRLYEEERVFNAQVGKTLHFDSTRDGVVIPRQLELRAPDGRLRVVEIGRSNADLAIRLPYNWSHSRHGTKVFWYFSNRRPFSGQLFEAMLYGEIQAALHVLLEHPAERIDLSRAIPFQAPIPLLLRDFEVPVCVKQAYRQGNGKPRVVGSIAGWEAYLLCDRCFQ